MIIGDILIARAIWRYGPVLLIWTAYILACLWVYGAFLSNDLGLRVALFAIVLVLIAILWLRRRFIPFHRTHISLNVSHRVTIERSLSDEYPGKGFRRTP